MSRSFALVVGVLVVGYSLYGGLLLAGTIANDSLARSDGLTADSGAGVEDTAGFSAGHFQFADVSSKLNYTYVSKYKNFQETVTNAGVYAADYNNDGWEDILAIGGEQPRLFTNVNGSFTPAGAIPTIDQDVRGALWLDYNTDGHPDLVLLPAGAAPILLENVGGEFERRPEILSSTISIPMGATTADFDRDGCPDLFIYQNGDWNATRPVGYRNYSVPINADNGNPDFLYRGTCDGFERVEDAGVAGDRWTLAASFLDLNADGYPDIHTANDINHDVVYVNQQDGSFEQIVLPERTNRHGMSSEVADVTGDGAPDIFVTNIYYPEWAARMIGAETELKARGNNLISNLGDGTFVMRGEQYGITSGGFGWAAVIADFDNDADEDLFHTTRDMLFERRDLLFTDAQRESLRSKGFYAQPALWERANVTSFRQISAEASGFSPANGRGVARLDYDRDGDIDLVVATTDEYRVYENRLETRGNAVQLRVLGPNGTQTGAYGAVVTDAAGEQRRFVHARTDLLSQDSRVVHLGIGNRSQIDLQITWSEEEELSLSDVPAGHRLVVTPDGVRSSVELNASRQRSRMHQPVTSITPLPPSAHGVTVRDALSATTRLSDGRATGTRERSLRAAPPVG